MVGLSLLLAIGCAPPAAEKSPDEAAAEAPPGLDYVPPEPGSYQLPPIQAAADGAVLDSRGVRHRLFDYLGDRYVVLSFIYTRCVDAEGCPLAHAVFARIQRELERDPELAGRVRLVSLSFDPVKDTPQSMERYAEAALGTQPPDNDSWVFLTTASQADLDPILDGYGQYVVAEVDESGRPTGLYSHVLKVFLIDRERQVRNIYSSSFLHPALVVNDVKTLMLEEKSTG